MNEQGVALWRKIAGSLIEDIESGQIEPHQRLPSSETLAVRFGVNRHTVLRAISHLQSEGRVRIERGRGTFAVVNPLVYDLGPSQLFEQNLAKQNLAAYRTVISVVECHAPTDVGVALQIPKGELVLLVTTLGEADHTPINFGYHYIASSRLPGIEKAFRALQGLNRQKFSFSKLFNNSGMTDYRRKNVRIRSRPPSTEVARYLGIPATENVLVTIVTSVGPGDVPLTHAETCFASSRVELTVDF